MVLGVVALVVLCCLGTVVLGLFSPSPSPAPYQPFPTVSSS
jgi:hypothetical protein